MDKDDIVRSRSYRAVKWTAKVLDDWYLDPIIGLIPYGVGDVVTALCLVLYLYVAIFKVRSLQLALAVALNTLCDILVGIVPFLGDIADFFFKSHRRSYRLITGYVEGDESVLAAIHRSTFLMVSLVVVVLLLVIAAFCLLFRLFG